MVRGGEGLKRPNKIPFAHLEYKLDPSDLERFQKAYVGVVVDPRATYNLHEYFNMKGYFRVKVTPMGANLCLLEEDFVGEITSLIEEVPEWINQWFKEIRNWRPHDVDNQRLTWLRVYGLPCHAWNPKVFDFMSKPVGHFVCADKDTTKLKCLDVAIIIMSTKYCLVLNETYNIAINEVTFNIKVMEDGHAPMRISVLSNKHNNIAEVASTGSSEEDSEDLSGEWNENVSDEIWEDSFVQEIQHSNASSKVGKRIRWRKVH